MAGKSNITEYGFGQYGSAFTSTANTPIYPPKDLVIVAITFLADTQLELLGTNAGGLTSDTVLDIAGQSQSLWIGTDVAAHDEANHVDDDAHNGGGTNDAGVITLAAASDNVKVGMIVEHSVMCPRDLDNPYIVKSVSGANITLAKKDNPRITAAVAANEADGDNVKAYFYDSMSQGQGGAVLTNAITFPRGVTIYGRWTGVEIGDGKTGSLITYFGV